MTLKETVVLFVLPCQGFKPIGAGQEETAFAAYTSHNKEAWLHSSMAQWDSLWAVLLKE